MLIHEGGFQSLPPGYVNNCDGISGAIVDIVSRLSSRVDVVLSGHTHQAYNCELPNSAGHEMLVTSASSFGRVATDVEIKMDRATGDVTQASADNVIVTRDVPTDPAEDAIIAKYNGLIADVKNQVIGSITGDITRTANAAGEQALGDVIADAQLEATDDEFGAQLALMNPGGIRADLVVRPGRGVALPGDLQRGLHGPAVLERPGDDGHHRRPAEERPRTAVRTTRPSASSASCRSRRASATAGARPPRSAARSATSP